MNVLRKRITRVALLLAFAVLWDWAPWTPPVPLHSVAQVKAQPPNIFGTRLGNQIFAFTASQQCINTTASCLIFTGVIPPGLYATPPSTTIIGAGAQQNPTAIVQGTTANVITQANVVGAMPIPVHVSLKGMVSYASGTINAAAYWGKGTGNATLSLVSAGALTTAYTPPAAMGNQGINLGAATGNANPQAPVNIDCWAIAVATANGTINSLGSGVLTCRTEIANLTATPGATNIFLVSTPSATTFQVASPQVLNIRWNWGSAAAGNALVIYSATVSLGW